MKYMIHGFLLALSYFTIIPVNKELDITGKTYKYMLLSFPLIGLILATLTVGSFLFFEKFYHPMYAAIIPSVAYLISYGLIHLEAVCDVVDAWTAKYSNKDVYEVMKDPHIGAIGALAAFCLVILKVSILTLLLYERKFEVIFICLMFSRLNLVFALNYFEFRKESFLAKCLKKEATRAVMFKSFVYIIIAFLINVNVAMLFVISVCLFFISLKILQKRFGFLNGDCIGFSIEKTEVILLNLGLLFI